MIQVLVVENNIGGVELQDITLGAGLHIEDLPDNVPVPRIGEYWVCSFSTPDGQKSYGGVVERVSHRVFQFEDNPKTYDTTVWVRSFE